MAKGKVETPKLNMDRVWMYEYTFLEIRPTPYSYKTCDKCKKVQEVFPLHRLVSYCGTWECKSRLRDLTPTEKEQVDKCKKEAREAYEKENPAIVAAYKKRQENR